VPRFERGFLAACQIDYRERTRLVRLVGNPAWSTVRELSGGPTAIIALHPVMRALRVLALDSVSDDGQWQDLLDGTERAIEVLRYRFVPRLWQEGRWRASLPEHVAAVAACRALPRLRCLHVDGTAEEIAAVVAGPVSTRLEELGLVTSAVDPVERAMPLFAATVPRLRVVRPEQLELVVERGANGYERAHLTVGATSPVPNPVSAMIANLATALVARLPTTVRAIELSARRHFPPNELDQIREIIMLRAG
jgi:hypothetical protein